MKKILLILLSVLLCLNIFTGCFAQDSEQETKKTNIFVGKNGDFSIEAPKSWKDATDKLNENAQIELAYTKDECYLIALMEKKVNFINLNSFYKNMSSQTKSRYGIDALGETQEVEVNEKKGYLNRFDVTHNGIVVVMWVYTLETENHYGQIVCWTKKSNEDKYADKILGIIQSFKEISPEQEK